MNFVIRYVFLHSIRFDFQTDGVVGIKGVGRNVFIISMMKCFVQESMLFIWRVERIFPEYLIKGVVLISISQVYHPPPHTEKNNNRSLSIWQQKVSDDNPGSKLRFKKKYCLLHLHLYYPLFVYLGDKVHDLLRVPCKFSRNGHWISAKKKKKCS